MNRIVIIVEGGNVQAVHSDEEILIHIVDHDTQGIPDNELEEFAMDIYDHPRQPDSLGMARAILKEEISKLLTEVRGVYTIAGLKHNLRIRDYFGDRWAVAMGAFFDLCAVAYERIDLPGEWGYHPGAAGNTIDNDNMFADCWDISDENLLDIGTYLFRLTEALKNTGHSY